MAAIKPFSDVVSELAQCCRDKRDGVFFITTESNRSAYLTLKQGSIESIHYMNKRGADALDLLRSVKAGTCRFSEGAENAMFRAQPLPKTEVILAVLADNVSDDQTPKSEAAPTANPVPAQNSLPGDNDELLQLLIEFMGPMASVVYDDAKETTPNAKLLIKKLAMEIPDNYQQSEFIERAHKLVRGEG